MSARLAVRPGADRDIEQQAEFYATESGANLAVRFLMAVEDAYTFIRKHPDAGAPHSVANPRLAGLRSWPVPGFDDVRMYYLRPEQQLVRILRVLHGRRNVAAILADEEGKN